MTQDSVTDLEDRWAVMKGVHCCLDGSTYLVQEQIAIGEGGRCAGSRLHVFVAFNNCEEC